VKLFAKILILLYNWRVNGSDNRNEMKIE